MVNFKKCVIFLEPKTVGIHMNRNRNLELLLEAKQISDMRTNCIV